MIGILTFVPFSLQLEIITLVLTVDYPERENVQSVDCLWTNKDCQYVIFKVSGIQNW